MMKFCVAGIVALMLAGNVLGADPLPAGSKPKAAAQALSPEVQKALADMSSEDFKTREAALAKLEVALGQQMAALVASDDPEVQSRLTTLLQFNEGMTRWMIEAMKLPNEQRKVQMEFSLRPDVLPTLALAFSVDSDKRLQAVGALSRMEEPEATTLLARLLDDPDRTVYVAAMEAVWDRKPNEAVVDALWVRAVEAGFRGMVTQSNGNQPNVLFRGKPVVGGVVWDNSFYKKTQDSALACEVLIHMNAPQLVPKLREFVEGMEKSATGTGVNIHPWIFNNNSEPAKNAFKLMEVYRPKDVIASLYVLATSPVKTRMPGTINNEKYFWSNRTAPLATVITATDQKTDDYQLKRMTMLGGMWCVPTEEDENNAVKKLQAWAEANGKTYGIGMPREAATQPAQAEEPNRVLPGNMNQLPAGVIRVQGGAGGMQIQGGVIQVQGGAAAPVQIQVQVGPAEVPAPPAK